MDLTYDIERILTNAAEALRRRATTELKLFARSLEKWLAETLPNTPDGDVSRAFIRFLVGWERDGLFVDEDSRAALEAWLVAKGRAERAGRQHEAASEPTETGGILMLPPGVSLPISHEFDERFWRMLALIRQVYPPEEWLGKVRELLAAYHASPQAEAAILESFLRDQEGHELRRGVFQPPPGWQPPKEPKPRPTILDLVGKAALGVDKLIAEKRMDDLLEALNELVARMPELVPEGMRGGIIEEVVREMQQVMQLVLAVLAALPPEAAELAVDLLQLFLDVGGLIPGAGEPFDALSMIIALRRGEKLDAALSAISLVPFAGVLTGGGKLLIRARKLLGLIGKLRGPVQTVLRKLVDFLIAELMRFRPGLNWLKNFLAGAKKCLAETVERLRKLKQGEAPSNFNFGLHPAGASTPIRISEGKVYKLVPSNDGTGPRRWMRTNTGNSTTNTTRLGVRRENAKQWRALRDLWDRTGHGHILSKTNRARIAKGETPIVDEAWVEWFPGDKSLIGEQIPMHHIQGSPLVVPLPHSRHKDAHMPGGFRNNPGNPGKSG